MALQRWDPFAEMRRFHSYFDHQGASGFPVTGRRAVKNSWYIPLDAVEEGDDLLVRASVPGVKPEDIEVTIEDGDLNVFGRLGEPLYRRRCGAGPALCNNQS